MEEIFFTHLWVTDFGWENTIYSPNDFTEVEELGQSKKDGVVFICIQDNGKHQICKGYYCNIEFTNIT